MATSLRFGRYEVVERIGEGPTGEVYRAHDPAQGRDVAVKTMSVAARGPDEGLRGRFLREAEAASRLTHPNLVAVHDFGQEDDRLWAAMELLPGRDLRHAIAEGSLARLERKLDVLVQVAAALAHAHAQGVVHRDLKPANVHLLPDGLVKVVDLGLAGFRGSEKTRLGGAMAAPHYLSPEQVRNERADERSDVFALGCLAYEVLSGRKAFEARSPQSVLFRILEEEPEPLASLVPGLPPDLLALVERALAKDPARRLASTAEALETLQQVRSSLGPGGPAVVEAAPPPSRPAPEPTGPRPAAPPPRAAKRPSWTTLAAAGALAILAVAVAAALALRPPDQASRPAAAPRPAWLVSGERLTEPALLLKSARRQLGAGDHRGAAREAERTLALVPDHPEARTLLASARLGLAQAEGLADEVRQARAAPDPAAAGQALWRLMQADPDHPLLEDALAGHEAAFGPRAEEAREQMRTARAAAEEKRAGALDAFQEAEALAADAEASLQAGRSATAARRFLAARLRYDRARLQAS